MDILGDAARMMGGSRLRDMIRAVRACKTAAEERAVIAKECANLRTAFKENDIEYRHRNVAKLMFIHMLGYPTHFGQMECLKLIASPGFPEKRIGYLGLMVLLDERQEVLMLVTNSLKNDLNHTNQFICGLALCALGNICSSEMARDLAPEVERLLNSNNSYIRKKAALCSIRIIRKVPDLADYLVGPASSLLQDKHHGVLISGTKLAIELCKANPQMVNHFRKQVPGLVRILKNLVVSGYAPEYDVGGITDPFLQIRILRLLRILGKGDPDSSDLMSDILAQVATNTEANKNTGNSILYECVNTIFGVESIGGLRVLAINILGRFLTNRDNNIRYVALNTLIKVVSVDTQAVQRHRSTVIECVKDADISIRRRALDLVYALVNEGNLQALTGELLGYLKNSDNEFKPDLTNKICALVQRLSPSKRYTVDVLHQVVVEVGQAPTHSRDGSTHLLLLLLWNDHLGIANCLLMKLKEQKAGEYVKDDVVNFLVVSVSNAPELHGYTVRRFYSAFKEWKGQESLGVVTAWCVGEYGEMLLNNSGLLEGETPLAVTEAEVLSVLDKAMRDPRASTNLRACIMLALLKLTLRFPSSLEKITDTITQHRQSLVLELQQRAVEFSSILARHDKLKGALVDKIPALDEAAYRAKRTDLSAAPVIDSGFTAGAGSASSAANGSVAVPMAPALADLLDLSMDDPAPAGPASAGAGGGGNALLDLLGGAASAPAAPTGGAGAASALLDLLSLGDTPSAPLPPAAPGLMPSAPLDPLAALMGGPLAPTAPAQAAPAAPLGSSGMVDPFGDPFGMGAPTSASAPPAGPPSIVAFEGKGLSVSFSFTKNPSNAQATTILATFRNSSSQDLTDFVFQAAVPKFMQLQLEPASGAVVPANGAATVSQAIKVINTMQGQKVMAMRLRISYKVAGQDVLQQTQVSNFPAGF